MTNSERELRISNYDSTNQERMNLSFSEEKNTKVIQRQKRRKLYMDRISLRKSEVIDCKNNVALCLRYDMTGETPHDMMDSAKFWINQIQKKRDEISKLEKMLSEV